MDYFFYSILSFLIWPAIIIILIIYALVRRSHKHSAGKNRSLQLALSRDDAASQWFFLLSLLFLGVTLLAFNRDFGNPVSGLTIIFITCLFGFLGTYHYKTIYTLLVSLLGFLVWWTSQAFDWSGWGSEAGIMTIFVGVIVLMIAWFGIGRLHEMNPKYQRFAAVYILLSLLALTGVLFLFSGRTGLQVIESLGRAGESFETWQVTLSLLLFSLLAIGSLTAGWRKVLILHHELIQMLCILAVFIALLFTGQSDLFSNGSYYSRIELTGWGFFWAGLFNIMLLLHLLALIFSGYLRRQIWMINLGAFCLFIFILVKYFDWFFSSLDKSVFFIGAGILLFLVGWFMERGRRYMVSAVRATEPIK